MLITDLLFEGRREEAFLRADLSAHLTGAGRIQLVIDGDVTRVLREAPQQAHVAVFSPKGDVVRQVVYMAFALMDTNFT